jgi:type II protein arginine methyltransferase
MLNDHPRNVAFTEAVTRAVATATARLDGSRPTVLEIGSGGTGLLAMAAAKAGALPVLSVELDPVLARKARETVAHNKFSESIRVLEVHSEALCREDLGAACGAHVIVAELFDDRLLGECILPTFQHALDHLACNKPDDPPVITVPARACIQARLVTSPTLELMAATQGAAGGVSILLQTPLDSIEPLNLDALPDLTYLSDEWCE